MIEPETIYAVMPSVVMAVGVWVALNSDIAKMKGRVTHLEADRAEMKILMRELTEAITELRVDIAESKGKNAG
jgi:hypothetical protein